MNKKNIQDDIIVAIATPLGVGGISIVRLSGDGSIDFVNQFFHGKTALSEKKSHTLSYGNFIDENEIVIDEVLVSIMKAPTSYTTEDIVEINCHGGTVVTRKILEILLCAGIRLAEAGEFTKRAFLNGRIDLTQAEGIIDMIHAKTDTQAQVAVHQMEGNITKKVREYRDQLLDLIAQIEMAIDYPDQEDDIIGTANIEDKLCLLVDDMTALLKKSEQGKLLREGLEVAILGKPNVGKSSLLNWLLNENRAIVTEVAGTTRDTLEEFMNIGGIPIKIVDTAGIRTTTDVVEKIGVEKSKQFAKSSQCILLLLDYGRPLDEEDREILDFIDRKKTIVLLNKTDLPQQLDVSLLEKWLDKESILSLSIKEEKGYHELIKKIEDLFIEKEELLPESVTLGNVRHKTAMQNCISSLQKASDAIHLEMGEDFVSMDLQEANASLGEITGDTYDEEIIHRIFTKFCLGK
ncbi:MAG: tRNA uridine-5-carboxymethylaminomethyl(34) synthesis GTPase MnmE [Bacillota bacterium]